MLHLLYARFWHKVLFDLGHVVRTSPTPACSTRATSWPPRTRTTARSTSTRPRSTATNVDGFTYDGEPVTREWGKMGKSLKNAVSPDEMYDEYGADTLRLYEMAMRPARRLTPVGDPRRRRHVPLPAATVAQHRRRGHRRVHRRRRTRRRRRPRKLLHRTIDVVRTEMDALRFNTAIAKLIELNNARHQARRDASRRRRADGR